MEARDPYAVLGVDRDADEDAIHRAYRELARRAHPDIAAGGDDRMAAINDAWYVLGDPDRRATYDQAHPRADRYERPRRGPEAPSPPDPLFGPTAQRTLRSMVIASIVLLLVMFAVIVLVGFERMGT